METLDVISYVRPVLAATPHRWNDLITTFPTDLLNMKPKAGEWSALQCFQHILISESMFQFRLNAFLEGAESFPPFSPDIDKAQPASSPLDMAAEFSRMRQDSLSAVDRLTPNDMDLKSRHPELGPVTMREFLNEWASHDLNHTVQAERAIMQPFLKNCGPWVKYFTDHLVKE